MEYKITNRQHLVIFNKVYDYIEDMIDTDQVYLQTDKDTGEEGIWILMTHDFDDIFIIYFREYWADYTEEGKKRISESPILVLSDDYKRELNGLFGKIWIEPMKTFVKRNFGVDIKTIDLED